MAWLPDGEKNFADIFIRFGVTHERDRQTDRRTDTGCRHIPRLCIASRGKKEQFRLLKILQTKTDKQVLDSISFCKDSGKFISRMKSASYRRITLSRQQVLVCVSSVLVFCIVHDLVK